MKLITLWDYWVINRSQTNTWKQQRWPFSPEWHQWQTALQQRFIKIWNRSWDRWQCICQCRTYKFCWISNFVMENLVDITTLWETPTTIYQQGCLVGKLQNNTGSIMTSIFSFIIDCTVNGSPRCLFDSKESEGGRLIYRRRLERINLTISTKLMC